MTDLTCDNCDSMYTVTFKEEDTTGYPEYCPFCGESIVEDEDDYEPNDFVEPKWED